MEILILLTRLHVLIILVHSYQLFFIIKAYFHFLFNYFIRYFLMILHYLSQINFKN